MRILYLAPLMPAPSGSGGKRAIYNHLEDMLGDAIEVDAVFVNVEGETVIGLDEFARFHPRVFGRAIAKFGDGLKGKLSGIGMLLLSSMPRSLAVVASQHARDYVSEVLTRGGYDAVVVDHLNAYGMLRGLPLTVPVLYIAHNIESEVLRQAVARLPRFSPRRLIASLDCARMRRVERELLAICARVLVIGAGDSVHGDLRDVADKVVLWPELPQLKALLWSFPNTKNLLFVGSAKYFPNKDAIRWLVDSLMPALREVDPAVTLHVAGSASHELGYDADPVGTIFHGFVSDARLDALHREAALFVCPVVLGAGIKIKMLEAASYGLPSAATPASLLGINFLHDAALQIDREVPASAAAKIAELLRNPDALKAISTSAVHGLKAAIHARASLLEHIRTTVSEHCTHRVKNGPFSKEVG